MDELTERIEMAGYHAGRATPATVHPGYRNPMWTEDQQLAYLHQYLQGMAYSVIKGECRICPNGLIISVEQARDILGLDDTE